MGGEYQVRGMDGESVSQREREREGEGGGTHRHRESECERGREALGCHMTVLAGYTQTVRPHLIICVSLTLPRVSLPMRRGRDHQPHRAAPLLRAHTHTHSHKLTHI